MCGEGGGAAEALQERVAAFVASGGLEEGGATRAGTVITCPILLFLPILHCFSHLSYSTILAYPTAAGALEERVAAFVASGGLEGEGATRGERDEPTNQPTN